MDVAQPVVHNFSARLVSTPPDHGDGCQIRKVVTTVKVTISIARPSTLRSFCAPIATAASAVPSAQAYVLGQPAVAVQLPTRLVPTALFAEASRMKINNYMSNTSAKGEGTTLSIVDPVSGMPAHLVSDVTVKGADARGIPPRGRPV